MKNYSILTVLMCVAFLWSCQEYFTEEADPGLTVEKAKKHFGELVSSGELTAERFGDIKDFDLVWSKAYSDVKDNTEYVEVPLITKRRTITLYSFDRDNIKFEPDESVLQYTGVRMMFYKDTDGQIKEKFLVYLPDKEYLIRRKAEMGLNTVRKMQSNFKGYVEYSDWEGNVLSVERFENGERVRDIYSQITTVNPKIQMPE